jgi:DnaJ-class molecular chaperone
MVGTVALSTLEMRAFTEGHREGGGFGGALGDDARCPHCGGRGSYDRPATPSDRGSWDYVRTTCPHCQGSGRSR